MMEPVIERRAHHRAEVSNNAIVRVRYNASIKVQLDSLSLGGARLTGEISVGAGERIQICFEIEGQPIELDAEVLGTRPVDVTTSCVAIVFVDVEKEASDRLRRVVGLMHTIEQKPLSRS